MHIWWELEEKGTYKATWQQSLDTWKHSTVKTHLAFQSLLYFKTRNKRFSLKVDSCSISIAYFKSFLSCKKKRINKQKGETGASCYNFSSKHTPFSLCYKAFEHYWQGKKMSKEYVLQTAGHVVTLWELDIKQHITGVSAKYTQQYRIMKHKTT